MCSYTHEDPQQCDARRGPYACHWKAQPAPAISSPGPRQPLDELAQLRQENERLRLVVAAIRGTIVSALLADDSREAVERIARDLGIEFRQVVDAKGERSK